jgi:hypothetical protein
MWSPRSCMRASPLSALSTRGRALPLGAPPAPRGGGGGAAAWGQLRYRPGGRTRELVVEAATRDDRAQCRAVSSVAALSWPRPRAPTAVTWVEEEEEK